MISRRSFLTAAAGAPIVLRANTLAARHRQRARTRPVPTPAQLVWQRDELALFLHFGVNTFTDREWGDGTEDPAIFAPVKLDANQWARAAKAAGAKAMVLTAKHHDGFCLWPTKTTSHSVAASPFRGGRGDVVREFVDACRANGLRAGLYLSPWDRNAKVYGDGERYNLFYRDQLTELLTQYGPIAEVWFDGANGEGPNGKRQVYDWPATWNLVRRLQPDAVMFSDAGPDVRWIGNENGVAGETNWSTVDPSVVPVPGMSGAAVTRMLREGDPNGSAWRPGETDVSIRPGWFHHPAEDARVRSVDKLVNLYFTSVGRNSKLLLNVPPARDGLLHETDIERLTGMRSRLNEMFAEDLAPIGRRSAWKNTGESGAQQVITFGRVVEIAISDLREDIAGGQVVGQHSLEGSLDGEIWQPLSSGTTIGYRKLTRFPSVRAQYVRLTIRSAAARPGPVAVSLYG